MLRDCPAHDRRVTEALKLLEIDFIVMAGYMRIVGEEFLEAFSSGLTVLGYERDSAGNGSFLLGHWDENWSYASEAPDEN